MQKWDNPENQYYIIQNSLKNTNSCEKAKVDKRLNTKNEIKYSESALSFEIVPVCFSNDLFWM